MAVKEEEDTWRESGMGLGLCVQKERNEGEVTSPFLCFPGKSIA